MSRVKQDSIFDGSQITPKSTRTAAVSEVPKLYGHYKEGFKSSY